MVISIKSKCSLPRLSQSFETISAQLFICEKYVFTRAIQAKQTRVLPVNLLHHIDVQELTELDTDLFHHTNSLKAKYFVKVDTDIIGLCNAGDDSVKAGSVPFLQQGVE